MGSREAACCSGEFISSHLWDGLELQLRDQASPVRHVVTKLLTASAFTDRPLNTNFSQLIRSFTRAPTALAIEALSFL
jgi:hypothetical protein